MSNSTSDAWIDNIVGAIADGDTIDWAAVKERDPSVDPDVVDQLEILQRISSLSHWSTAWDGLQLLHIIGEGASGTVFRGVDALQRDVAVKILRPLADGSFNIEKARAEALMLARVRHPNVVNVYSVQEQGDAIAVAMELVQGLTLQQLISMQGTLSPREAMVIGIDVCRGLAAIHQAGLLHGDVKAQNVMRQEGGRIVLMDLGSGRRLSAAHPSGDFAGTPLYMAPEVFAGETRSVQSDIYSAGVLLFYLATATHPVSGDSQTAIERTHAAAGPQRRLRDLRPDLPGDFVALVECATNPDRRLRFQTAGEFEAALVLALGDGGTVVPPRRSLRKYAALGALACAAALALIVFIRTPRQERAPELTATTAATLAPPAGATTAPGSYRVQAAMFRSEEGGPRRLRLGERLSGGDKLFLEIQTSTPAFVYVVNEDDLGSTNLLYPLPHSAPAPLSAATHTLPGMQGANEVFWQVTSRGKKEYFLIFASPERLPDVEQTLLDLPPPGFGVPILSTPAPLAPGALRSVGGLTAAAPRPRLSERYTSPLTDLAESVSGLWVRQIVFDNP